MRRRGEKGYFDDIFAELSVEDTGSFREMIPMSKEDYNYILTKIEKCITPKQIIGGYKIINGKARLALTYNFLRPAKPIGHFVSNSGYPEQLYHTLLYSSARLLGFT